MAKLIATDSVPPHGYYPGTEKKCLICGNGQDSPIHNDWLAQQDPEFLESVGQLPSQSAPGKENSDAQDDSEDDGDEDDEVHSGVMVALMVPRPVADELAIPDGEPANNMHCTLAYLGLAEDLQNPDDLIATVKQFAEEEGRPIAGKVGGLGLFTTGEDPVTYAAVDAPDLPSFRQQLIQVLTAAGFNVDNTHGFTPHITLAFSDQRHIDVPNLPLVFATLTVAIAGKKTTFPMGEAPETSGVHKKHKYKHPVGEIVKKNVETHIGYSNGVFPPCAECGMPTDHEDHDGPDGDMDADDTTTTASYIQVVDRHEPVAVEVPVAQTAFVSEINGRTLITGPASVDNIWEKALTPNPHMMWLQGRFVGADEPNRNKAYWSTKDLELGQSTVTHGPLNWLHESRHIIGSIADHRLVYPPERADGEKQLPTHVAAVAGIWKWIYPDEAFVIEQASDQGKSYFSMECISENVECIGDGGCGRVVSYADYLKNDGCTHMAERSAVRRFDNPTFLGGAVIVPPVRPGWADADARVVREAASLAEAAFEQVKPDMVASEWEALMRQVVAYAHFL